MAFFLRYLVPSFDWLRVRPQDPGPFKPTYVDICLARAMLKTLRLPTELVLDILEHACYWPTYEFRPNPNSTAIAIAHLGRTSGATLCLEAAVFNNRIVNPIRRRGEKPQVKRIEFEISSRDQGWTSENTEGTYATSSWLEVSILRNNTDDNTSVPISLPGTFLSSPLEYNQRVTLGSNWSLVRRPESAEQGPQDGEGDLAWYLQGNRVAAGLQDYRVVWTLDGHEGNEGAGGGHGFLEELKDGDRIVVWGRAKYHGWQCIIEDVKVTVYYGV
ncbi:hypothetical protein IQ07DRAFT_518384 [Pyrenochaeta sp. DS3sAY3a]|nr:hypothetical protein IQ07DRAFT_518384 [Pyrenochaeta sp. DS3sAY3a]